MRRRDTLAAAAAYGFLTLVLTWPLARGLARDLPADFGDPLLNSWILAWDAQHLLQALAGQLSGLREYWNANIYHPHPLALAYSEHLTAQAVMIVPVYALTGNPILSYNVLFLSTFVLSALGMFLFVRELTGSSGAAFIAGLAFGFAPYRFGALAHVQVLSSMWMPFVLLGFHRFFESRRRRPLAAAAVAWVAQNLSSGYYLLFFSPVVALFVALEITRRKLWSDKVVGGGVTLAAAAVALATAPFLLPYWRLRRLGFSPRSLAETMRYSADVYGYVTADIGLRLWGQLARAWPQPENALFPGAAIAMLAAFGVVHEWRRRHPGTSGRPTPVGWAARVLVALLAIASAVTLAILAGWTLRLEVAGVEIRLRSLERGLVFVVGVGAALLIASAQTRDRLRRWIVSPAGALSLVTLLAFSMSLGPRVLAQGRVVAEQNVYWPFYALVPGFDGLRVPARFAMIVALGLAALAGLGAAAIARQRHGTSVLALAGLLIVAEAWAVPIARNVNPADYGQSGLVPLAATLPTARTLPPVYRFVEQLPASSALVELPFGEVAFETRYMFNSTFHWRRLVNGYSGGAPDEYGQLVTQFRVILEEPDAAWRAILASRATHIIVHEGSYAGDRGPRISAWALARGAQDAGTFDSDRVFVVPRSRAGCIFRAFALSWRRRL